MKRKTKVSIEPPPLCEKQMHTEYWPSAESYWKDIQGLCEGLVCKKMNPYDSRQDQNTPHNRRLLCHTINTHVQRKMFKSCCEFISGCRWVWPSCLLKYYHFPDHLCGDTKGSSFDGDQETLLWSLFHLVQEKEMSPSFGIASYPPPGLRKVCRSHQARTTRKPHCCWIITISL